MVVVPPAFRCLRPVINPAGNAYVYSTFLGGSLIDAGDGIAVDSSGNAYVTGLTESTDFPQQGGLQTTCGGGTADAFVTKVTRPEVLLCIRRISGAVGSTRRWHRR